MEDFTEDQVRCQTS